MNSGEYRRLRGLLKELPFELEDARQINELYLAWRAEDGASERRKKRDAVELWTYCWVRRYFMQKLGIEKYHDPAAFDKLISKTFVKISRALQKGTEVDRYAHWVSVICKNTYLNYLSRRSDHVSADSFQGGVSAFASHPPEEVGFVRQEISAAVDRLPDFLKFPVRARILEGKSYEQISEEMGKDEGVIRSYVSRGRRRLRKDANVLACRDIDDNESSSD